MSIERYQVSLKVILRDEMGRVLALNGRVGGMYEGHYDIPGGRIDESEFSIPFAEILRREVTEELGPDIQFTVHDTPVALGRHRSREGFCVLYVYFEGEIEKTDVAVNISKEHAGWAWLDLSKQPLEKLFTSGILEGMKQWYTARHK